MKYLNLILIFFIGFFLLPVLSSASSGQHLGCQPYPSSEVQTLAPMCEEPSQVTAIEKLARDTRKINEEGLKRELFGKLKTQAIIDQSIHMYKSWNYLGWGDQQVWDERINSGCLRSIPEVSNAVKGFIQHRNQKYAGLSEEAFKEKKQQEYEKYRKNLIRFAIKLKEIKQKIGASTGSSPVPGAKEAYEKLHFQMYYILDQYPILNFPLADVADLVSTQTKVAMTRGKIPLFSYGRSAGLYHLLDYYGSTFDPKENIVRSNLRSQTQPTTAANVIDAFLQKAIFKSWQNASRNLNGDAQAQVEGLCAMDYSDKKLDQFLQLDQLRATTLENNKDNEAIQKYACRKMDELRPQQNGFKKAVYYAGGMGLACGLGWVVSGGGACLVYSGFVGAGIGAYETVTAIQNVIDTHQDYNVLHQYFNTSVEGSSISSSQQYFETRDKRKSQMLWALVDGTLTAADVGIVTALLGRRLQSSAKAALAVADTPRVPKAPLKLKVAVDPDDVVESRKIFTKRLSDLASEPRSYQVPKKFTLFQNDPNNMEAMAYMDYNLTIFSPSQRELHRLHFKNGKFVRKARQLNSDKTLALIEKNADTSQGLTRNFGQITSDGKAIFVMDEYGDIYMLNEKVVGSKHHTSFFGDRKGVYAAGEIEIKDGVVTAINNNSGHFRPPEASNEQVLEVLRSRYGLDTSQIKVKAWSPTQ